MNSESERLPLHLLDESTALELLSSLVGQESFGVALFRAEEPASRLVFVNDAFRVLFPDAAVVGRTLAELLPEAADMESVLGNVARTGDPWVSRGHPITLRPGGRCDVRYYTYRMQRILLDQRAYVVVTALDVTAETRAAREAAGAREDLGRSADLIREHERVGIVLQAANDILESATAPGDDKQLAASCLTSALQIAESDAGFIARLDDAGQLQDLVVESLPAPVAPGGEHEMQVWLKDMDFAEHVGRLLATRQTVVVNAERGASEASDARNALLVPLRRDDVVVGALYVTRADRRYDDQAVHSLEMLMPSIASGLRTRRTMADLYASNRRLEAHMSNAPMAVIEFDMQFRVIRWSEEAERVFGYAPEEVLGKRISEMRWVYEEDVALVEAESRRMFAEGVTRSKNVNRNYRKDGSVIWCEWYSSAIHNQDGVMVSVLSRVFDITERREAEEKLLKQAQQANALRLVGEQASSALELQPLAQRLVTTIAEAAGADLTLLVLADEMRELHPIAAHGMSESTLTELDPAPGDTGVMAAFSQGEAVFAEHLAREAHDPRAQRALNAGLASVAALPLLIEDKPIGVVALGWRERHVFGAGEALFLQSLTREAAVGVQNALLFEAERSRRRRIQSLHGVLEVAVSSLDAAEAAQRILGYLMDHHTFDLANCWLARGDSLELLAAINYPREYAARFSPMSLASEYDSPRVHLSGESVVVADISLANPTVREMYAQIGVELGAYVIVPLRSRGHTVGTLNLGWHQPRPVLAADLSYFESLGSELGVVLENAELMREHTQQARYAEALNRINDAVHSTLELDEVIQRVVVDSAEVAEFQQAAVLLRRRRGWQTGYADDLAEEAQVLSDAELDLLLDANETGAVISVEVGRADSPVADLLARHGISAYLAVPLMAKGQVVGYLVGWSTVPGFAPQHRQVDFMRKVGATVSLALENVRLYEAERSIADRLQSALLTLPDQISGVSFAHAYRSATEAARVGGDFYDLFELGGNRVGIVMGDVAGKGIDAAVLTSLVKNTVQAHASEPGKTPGQVLELTNEVVYKSTSMEAFVTVFFGVLDCRDGTLAYANGGHTSGALVRPGGPIPLAVTGPLLGAFDNARFRDTWARLDMGDTLFLYTDGLTEARRGSEMLGEPRLFELLERLIDSEPEEMVSEVVGEAVSFTAGHLGDDMAILAIQLTGCDTTGPQQQRFPV